MQWDLMGKPERERPLGRSRLRWDDNIIMDLKDKKYEGVNWTHWVQDRDNCLAFVSTVMNLRLPKYAGNFFLAPEFTALNRNLVVI
jgi:hypothetical protein